MRKYCKPRGSGVRSGASGLLWLMSWADFVAVAGCVLRREKPLCDSGIVKERAGSGAGEIVPEKRVKIGFVVDVHLKMRVATMMNLRVRSICLGAVLRKTAGS